MGFGQKWVSTKTAFEYQDCYAFFLHVLSRREKDKIKVETTTSTSRIIFCFNVTLGQSKQRRAMKRNESLNTETILDNDAQYCHSLSNP